MTALKSQIDTDAWTCGSVNFLPKCLSTHSYLTSYAKKKKKWREQNNNLVLVYSFSEDNYGNFSENYFLSLYRFLLDAGHSDHSWQMREWFAHAGSLISNSLIRVEPLVPHGKATFNHYV